MKAMQQQTEKKPMTAEEKLSEMRDRIVADIRSRTQADKLYIDQKFERASDETLVSLLQLQPLCTQWHLLDVELQKRIKRLRDQTYQRAIASKDLNVG